MTTETLEAPAARPSHPPRPEVPKPRPVQLQVNNSGAWKSVARFDDGNEYHVELAHDAVMQLTSINSNYTWRIVTDESHPLVLRRWDSEGGWRNA